MPDDVPATHVVGADGPRRLDAFVHGVLPGLSRRLVQAVIRDGAVRVNGHAARKGTLLRPGDRVTVPTIGPLVPEPDLAVRIVYEDDVLVVVDKPGGMPGHALDPRQRGTVAAFLLGRWPEIATVGDALAPGLAHRLDTGTSGLLAVARTAAAWVTLRAAFRAGRVRKRYLAVVAGVTPVRATVDVALRHDPRDQRRMTPATDGARGWRARSVVESLAAYGDRQLVGVTIETGVTHQVRAHLALLGHPVLGDDLYGGPPAGLPPGRHALHAAALVLPHPTRDQGAAEPPAEGAADGAIVALESPLPADLAPLIG